MTAGSGRSHSPNGPGAGSPQPRISPRRPRHASVPVTFCSRIAGTRASRTAPVRPSRIPRWRRSSSATRGWSRGSKPARSSSSPIRSGTASRSRSAPGPHASASIAAADLAECDRRRARRRSASPARSGPPRRASSGRRCRGRGSASVRRRSSGPSTGTVRLGMARQVWHAADDRPGADAAARGVAPAQRCRAHRSCHLGHSAPADAAETVICHARARTFVLPGMGRIETVLLRCPRRATPSESSRAWRSSPCSPRPPSQDPSDPRAPALSTPVDATLFQGWTRHRSTGQQR